MKIQRSPWGRRRSQSRLGRRVRPRSATHAAARRSLAGIESLETRQLLAANLLASGAGTISSPDATSDVTMNVSLPNAPTSQTSFLAIDILAADGSSLDPDAATLTNSAGTTITPVAALDDMSGPGSHTVYELPAGEYGISVGGESMSVGGFDIQISLVGDVAEDDSRVGDFERMLASAAVVQTLGTGNFVTQEFYAQHGIDLTVDLYDPGMDVDGDGAIEPEDYGAVEHNSEQGLINVSLQADDLPPVISGVALQNDTGVSSSDRITVDPTIVGSISDESAISVFQASLDGGAGVSVLSSIAADGTFTLTLADLDNIAGGTLAEGSHTLTLTATDELGNETPTPVDFSFTYLIDNTISSSDIPDQTADEDASFSLAAGGFFTDPDVGDVVTYSASSNGGDLPGWLSFDAATGQLSGTPANDDVGSQTITVTATDSQDATASSSFSLTVENVNDAPTLAEVPNQTAGEDQPFSFNVAAFADDVDAGDVLTFSFASNGGALPDWLTGSSTGLLSGTPAQADVGSFNVTVTVDDLAGATASDTFQITVEDLGIPPQLVSEIADQEIDEDAFFSLDLSANFTDPDVGDSLTYTAVETGGTALPSWLNLNSSTGLLSGTPRDEDVGLVSITVTATDSTMLSANDTFVIDVINTTDPPQLISPIPDQTAIEDDLFIFDAGTFFQDTDPGDSISFTATRTNGDPLPAWISFDPVNGTFSGTPVNDDVGGFSVRITATDSTMLSTSDNFVITVENTNDAPTLVNPIQDQTATDGQFFRLDVSTAFDDVDVDDTLRYTATLADGGSLPGWLSLDMSTGIMSGTPDDPDVGTVEIRVVARDDNNSAAADNFMLEVINVNEAPIVQDDSFQIDVDITVGSDVGTVDALDPDGDTSLTYQITAGNDDGTFAINASSGVITVADTTAITEGVIFDLTVQVSDTGMPPLSGTGAITITVGANMPPIAVDDDGFETIDSRDIDIFIDDLTSNDSDPEGDNISLFSVEATSTLGASVEIDGINVVYDPTTSDTLVALRPGESRVDTFEYTLIDSEGGTDTATVSVTVEGVDVVQIRLETFDTDGNSIADIQTGGTFELRAFIQDIQPDPVGVFSAFMDVTYSDNLVTVDGNIDHSSTYGAGTSGDTLTAGLINEVGGVDGLSPLGGDEFEVFRLQFTAGGSPGVANFNSRAADDQVQHPILVFRTSAGQPDVQIIFGSATLNITGPASSMSSGTTSVGTNPDNPYDVNADESVSPLDALLVINQLSGAASGDTQYVDVNADGSVSPIDALLVINELDSAPQAALSSTAGGSGSGAHGGLVDELAGEVAVTDTATNAADNYFSDLGGQPGGGDGLELPGQFGDDSSVLPASTAHAADSGDQADEQDDLLTQLALAIV